MHALFPRRNTRYVPRLFLLTGLLVVFTLLLAACGNSSAPNPLGLINPGTLTVGSDTTYPPQEFVDTATGHYIGFDVDLISAMATHMGLKVNVVKADFNTILDSLDNKRFDVVISAVTINDARKKKADFVPYFNAGESLLVPKGNPKHLTSINDACGLRIGAQNATVELDDTNAANAACKQAGKPAITITSLDSQTDVVQLLATGRVDATYQDSPVTDYYLSLNPGQFDVGGVVVNAATEGIAVRPNDKPLFNAVSDAFTAIKSGGTYDSLFSKWHLSDSQKVSERDRRNTPGIA